MVILTNDRLPLYYKRFNTSFSALHKNDVRNAGYDLYARLDNSVVVQPNETIRIPLNVATEIPANCVGLLFQRSSTNKRYGLSLTNGVGVIDSLYCGDNDEWQAEFKNTSGKTQIIEPRAKLCQAVFIPLIPVRLIEVSNLDNPDRGGFGTSGD